MNAIVKYFKNGFSFCELMLTIFLLLPIIINAQVDERWLNNWNEANQNRPSKILSKSRIAKKDEPGVKLIIKGTIFNPDGTAAKNVIVHAYHRDLQGYDFGENDEAFSTWRLQGWAKTDKYGTFEFETIRPAPDHLGREGAHIHFTTISEKYGNQWAPKVFFDDDSMTTDSQRSKSKKYGKYKWICEVIKINDIQYIEVNIKLKNKEDF